MSKKLKLSPWHDINTDPCHIGVYKLKGTYPYSYWDGKHFCGAWCSVYDAYLSRNFAVLGVRLSACAEGATAWRGVLK